MRRRHSYATLLLGALAGSFPAAARADGPIALQEVSVTATREAQPLVETPASVGIITGETIQQVKPTHPWQIMNQVPGVAVGVTNGEGHTTAIRQPFTTSPVYLFLEDGIPSRSTGFFNHNGLYEINIPQAGGIEVVRGPGSALYGSDAVAGVINVLTPAPPPALEIRGSLELGDHGPEPERQRDPLGQPLQHPFRFQPAPDQHVGDDRLLQDRRTRDSQCTCARRHRSDLLPDRPVLTPDPAL